MGEEGRAFYRRLLVWFAAGLFLDWSTTVVALRFLPVYEWNRIMAEFVGQGDILIPIVLKVGTFLVFTLAAGIHVYMTHHYDMHWLLKAMPIGPVAIVWVPVVHNYLTGLGLLFEALA